MKAAKASILILLTILMGGVSARAEETAHTEIQVKAPASLALKPYVLTSPFSMGPSGTGLDYELRYEVIAKGEGSGSVSCPAITKKVSCYRPSPGSSGMSWTEYKVDLEGDYRSFAWAQGVPPHTTGKVVNNKCSDPASKGHVESTGTWDIPALWEGVWDWDKCNVPTKDGMHPVTDYCEKQMIELSKRQDVKARMLALFRKYYAGCTGTLDATVLEL